MKRKEARMPFSVRDLTEDDAPRAAELLNLGATEPVTVEQMRERLRARVPDRIVARLGAVNGSGELVVYGHAIRDGWMPPGLFWLHIVVDPAARRQGAGSQLYRALLDFVRSHGATTLRGEVRDNMPDDRRFAKRCGWRVERHIFESTLDLASFDERPFTVALDRALAAGIRFFSLADTGDTSETQRRLYELDRVVARDIPGGSEAALWPFETFLQSICEVPSYLPDGVIIAADSEAWIGECSVQHNATTNSMYNGSTGVLPAYRGRGIAQALKLLVIRVARRYDAASIRTNNDSENAPMLAINRKLGYTPEPGYYRMIADL
jgi:GNAT superfamily N-acetyltransferase